MQVGDKVVCVNNDDKPQLSIGEIYTISGEHNSYGDIFFYLEGIVPDFYPRRFRPLEEMQNENFVSIAKKETLQ